MAIKIILPHVMAINMQIIQEIFENSLKYKKFEYIHAKEDIVLCPENIC